MGVYKNDCGKYSIKTRYKDPNTGSIRWAHRYKGKHGFNRKSDAIEAEINLKKDLESKGKVQEQTLQNERTFREIVEECLQESKLTMKQSSLMSTTYALKPAHVLDSKKLSAISSKDIKDILCDMNNQGLAVKTIDKFYFALTKIFNFALNQGYIDKSPMSRVSRIKHPGEIRKERAYWTLDDYKLFISEVDNPLEKALYSTLFYGGLRKGEALALRWSDIDFDKGTINIQRTLSTVGTISNPIFTVPKSKNSVRKIRIPDILRAELSAWNEHEKLKYRYDDEMLVFGYDQVLSKNTVGAKFRARIKIGTKGTGWVQKNVLSGDLKVGNIVDINGKVYWRSDKNGGYQILHTKVRIVSINSDSSNNLPIEVEHPYPYIVLHGLRHSAVSCMINNLHSQKSIVAMAAHFGHTIDVMLTKYAHIYNDSEDTLMHEFNDILSGNTKEK